MLHPFLSLAVQLMRHVKPFWTDSCRMQMLPFSFRRGHEHEYFANITCPSHSKKTKPCLFQLLQEFHFVSMPWRQSQQLSNYNLEMWRYGFSHMLKQCAWVVTLHLKSLEVSLIQASRNQKPEGRNVRNGFNCVFVCSNIETPPTQAKVTFSKHSGTSCNQTAFCLVMLKA